MWNSSGETKREILPVWCGGNLPPGQISPPNVINKDPKLLVQSQPPAGQLGVEENPVVSEKRKTMEDLAVGWSDGKCDTKITIVRQESSCPR